MPVEDKISLELFFGTLYELNLLNMLEYMNIGDEATFDDFNDTVQKLK